MLWLVKKSNFICIYKDDIHVTSNVQLNHGWTKGKCELYARFLQDKVNNYKTFTYYNINVICNTTDRLTNQVNGILSFRVKH